MTDSDLSESGAPQFGDRLYRKRYLVTIIADRSTDGGDDWGVNIGDALGNDHCLWDYKEVECVELTPPSPLVGADDGAPDA